ncbi:hypothetical protein CC2G_014022 [Coprinopsis cinerea AmutBmut pab1-1]|nr:hypothetical protein CC2G_014022 [Coprinopsis cinerea AmutBmut pab1-1]
MMTTVQASLRLQKRSLRKSLSATLNLLSQESIRQQSKAITEKVVSLPQFQGSRGVSCYLSMPAGEASTSDLVSSILCQSDTKQLFVPKIVNKDGIMDFYEIFNGEDLASLPSGTWGIKEPDSHWQEKARKTALTTEAPTLDMILMPGKYYSQTFGHGYCKWSTLYLGVAFDRSFSRLGHGKGYYDRFISTYIASGRPKPLLVALALKEQLLEADSVPMGEHDWKVDIIVTPEEVLVNNDVGANAREPTPEVV